LSSGLLCQTSAINPVFSGSFRTPMSGRGDFLAPYHATIALCQVRNAGQISPLN
jgi:hypothetical protein